MYSLLKLLLIGLVLHLIACKLHWHFGFGESSKGKEDYRDSLSTYSQKYYKKIIHFLSFY